MKKQYSQLYIGIFVIIIYTISAVIATYYLISNYYVRHSKDHKSKLTTNTVLEINLNMPMSSKLIEYGSIKNCGKHINQTIEEDKHLAGLQEYPWMAILEYKFVKNSKPFECNGVILNERYILAPAHCLIRNENSMRKL